MNKIKLKSSAKVNLFFELLSKREDGYFQIETILQEIDLHDDILIKDIDGGDIHVKVSPSLNISKEDNIAYKAAQLLQRKSKMFNRGAEISIRKRIPVGRGFGGGSSNAAGVLKGLNKLWHLGFSLKELAGFGKELGMDVPFFIYGGTCLGSERGEIITPLPNFSGIEILLLWPNFSISTAEIYRSAHSNLTKKKRSAKLLIEFLKKKDLEGINKHLFNRLEDVAFKVHPPLYRFKKQIASLNTGNIIMSGSGSAFFAILPDGWKEEEYMKKKILKLKGGYYIGKTLPAA
jgi:4-diphosphocytidyl-2-C-methyl-D-erythritol kinase